MNNRCECGDPNCDTPYPGEDYQRRMSAAIAAQTADGDYFFSDDELYRLATEEEPDRE